MGTDDTLLKGQSEFNKGTVSGGVGRLDEPVRDGGVFLC